MREIRLKPGNYAVEARKGDKVVQRELVRVTRDGRQVVRVSQEPSPLVEKPAPAATDAAAWERSVAALPADRQVAAVAARLMSLNPGFDGHVTPTIKDGVVTELRFLSNAVHDLTPVRALTGLTALDCSGTWPSAGVLADLSPLRGLPLTSLKATSTRVHDLTPLRGMPLAKLELYVCDRVTDLEPLRGMPLTHLNIGSSKVADLTPLTGMRLTYLNLYGCGMVASVEPLRGQPLDTLVLGDTRVRVLAALAGMPLTSLNLYGCPISDLEALRGLPLVTLAAGNTQVRDLTPLTGMPLTSLNLWGCAGVRDVTPLRGLRLTELYLARTGVADLSPLRGMPLKQTSLSPKGVRRGLDALREMKGLKAIGIDDGDPRPAAEFWGRYDRGEFK